MPKTGFVPNRLKPWIDARQRYQLSHAQVQMARELGMSSNKLGSIANQRLSLWKLPLLQFIEESFQQRFGRKQPLDIRSIEQKEAERCARKNAGQAERAGFAMDTAGGRDKTRT